MIVNDQFAGFLATGNRQLATGSFRRSQNAVAGVAGCHGGRRDAEHDAEHRSASS
jgi:hypothetical protein